jgi:hypothetical protein
VYISDMLAELGCDVERQAVPTTVVDQNGELVATNWQNVIATSDGL